MNEPDPIVGLMQSAMRDAVIHRAYLHAALAGELLGTDGKPLRPVSEETARAMIVAYIQAMGVAKMKIELPPEPGEEREGWQG